MSEERAEQKIASGSRITGVKWIFIPGGGQRDRFQVFDLSSGKRKNLTLDEEGFRKEFDVIFIAYLFRSFPGPEREGEMFKRGKMWGLMNCGGGEILNWIMFEKNLVLQITGLMDSRIGHDDSIHPYVR